MITDFISAIKSTGLARTNRYKVTIPFPTGIGSGNDSIKIVSLFCDSASLPGVNIATNPARTYGESREMPYEKMYDTVVFSFYVDSDLIIKSYFEQWVDKVIDPQTRSVGYYNDYVKDIDIEVYNVDESQSPYYVTLYEAYPKSINAVNIDAASREVMKIAVTMQYKYWRAVNKNVSTTSNLSGSAISDPLGVNTNTGTDHKYTSNRKITWV